jgi:mRNA interferase RelE/StbE
MTYSVLLHPKAVEELFSLPKEMQARVKDALQRLRLCPRRARPKLDVRLLKTGRKPSLYRLRVGRYRVIFRVDWARREILVESISHRSKAYRSQ